MNRTGLFVAFAAVLALAALFPSEEASNGQPPPTRAVTVGTPVQPAPTQVHAATTSSGGAVTLSAKLGASTLPASTASDVFARVELQAALSRPERRERGPISLAVLLDRSGSMAGAKLLNGKRAVAALIDQLQEGDLLAIGHYGSDVRMEPSQVISEATRARLKSEVMQIPEYGGTNIGGALEAGLRALQSTEKEVTARRLILISDGQPTEGVTHPADLVNLAARIREYGIAVSALGIGSDFNDVLMRNLANHGGGFYAHLDRAEALGEILARELGQAVNAVAQQVELRLTPAEGVTIKDLFGFPHHRDGNSVVVKVYDLAVAQTARVLFELSVPAGFKGQQLVSAQLSYRNPDLERPESAQVALAATVSDDVVLQAASRDAEVYADSLRVIGGREIAKATEAYERGNRAEARSLFANVRNLFGSSAEALSGDLAAVEKAERDLESAGDAAAMKSRSMHVRKNLTSFGVNNSY